MTEPAVSAAGELEIAWDALNIVLDTWKYILYECSSRSLNF